MYKLFIFLSLVVLLTSCETVDLKKYDLSSSQVVDFDEVLKFAERAADSYKPDKDVKRKYSKHGKVTLGYGERFKLKWFVQEEAAPSNTTWVTIRGTENVENVAADVDYTKTDDRISGIEMHKGFRESTKEIYPELKMALSRDREILISGHSLGGAAALITLIWLHEEGYKVKSCYTFGQPKVMTIEGRKKYKMLPLVRVINKDDPVAVVPPTTIITAVTGNFRHIGDAIMLQDGSEYYYLDEDDASRTSVTKFWELIDKFDVKDHFMENYIQNIQIKRK